MKIVCGRTSIDPEREKFYYQARLAFDRFMKSHIEDVEDDQGTSDEEEGQS